MSAAMPAAFTLPHRTPAPIAAEPELDQRQAERGVTHLNHAWVDSQADWAESDLIAWDDRRRTVDPFNAPHPNEAAENRAARWFAAGTFVLVVATLLMLFAMPAHAKPVTVDDANLMPAVELFLLGAAFGFVLATAFWMLVAEIKKPARW